MPREILKLINTWVKQVFHLLCRIGWFEDANLWRLVRVECNIIPKLIKWKWSIILFTGRRGPSLSWWMFYSQWVPFFLFHRSWYIVNMSLHNVSKQLHILRAISINILANGSAYRYKYANVLRVCFTLLEVYSCNKSKVYCFVRPFQYLSISINN